MKLVEPTGEMLVQDWEVYATQLANAASDRDLISVINGIIGKESISMDTPARIIVGHDTRYGECKCPMPRVLMAI